jgi:hypothetical protein
MIRADRGQRSVDLALRRWRRHTRGQIDTVIVQSDVVDHHSMIRDPLVGQIAAPLSNVLSELVRNSLVDGSSS